MPRELGIKGSGMVRVYKVAKLVKHDEPHALGRQAGKCALEAHRAARWSTACKAAGNRADRDAAHLDDARQKARQLLAAKPLCKSSRL